MHNTPTHYRSILEFYVEISEEFDLQLEDYLEYCNTDTEEELHAYDYI